jgi:hypothetical protein
VTAVVEMEAPFLWLRFVVETAAVVVLEDMEVVTVVVVAVFATPLPLLSVVLLRDGLDREDVVAAALKAASVKVAVAGVDGLLARPLLVLAIAVDGGWMTSGAVSFLCCSGSSVGFAEASFLLPFCAGSGARGGSSTPGLKGGGLLRTERAAASF